jgi:hypothetical protein
MPSADLPADLLDSLRSHSEDVDVLRAGCAILAALREAGKDRAAQESFRDNALKQALRSFLPARSDVKAIELPPRAC